MPGRRNRSVTAIRLLLLVVLAAFVIAARHLGVPPGPRWLIVVAAGVVYAVAGYRQERPVDLRRERRAKGQCERCGYDLTSNTSGTCPECGSSTTRKRGRQRPDGGPDPQGTGVDTHVG
jgi:hypothetical protein